MKADSLEPPGRRGEERGCGRVECELVVEDVTDEAGGERRKPPAGESVMFDVDEEG